MARSHAAIYNRIWADPAWRALDVDAQHLYILLISQPQMNLAGVLPMQLRKWASCVAGWDIADVAKALDRLRDDRFILVDEDTEEVMVRTLIRNDGAYKIPNVLKSLLLAAEGTQAPALRRELAIELGRLDPLDGKRAEEAAAWIAATRLVLGVSDGPHGGGGETLPVTVSGTLPVTVAGTEKQPLPEPMPEGFGSGSGSGPSLSLVGTSVGRGETPPLSDEPPRCKRHADLADGEVPPCPPCGRLRTKWEAAVAEAAKPRPKPPWCGACNEGTRLVEVDDRTVARCERCHPRAVAS